MTLHRLLEADSAKYLLEGMMYDFAQDANFDAYMFESVGREPKPIRFHKLKALARAKKTLTCDQLGRLKRLLDGRSDSLQRQLDRLKERRAEIAALPAEVVDTDVPVE